MKDATFVILFSLSMILIGFVFGIFVGQYFNQPNLVCQTPKPHLIKMNETILSTLVPGYVNHCYYDSNTDTVLCCAEPLYNPKNFTNLYICDRYKFLGFDNSTLIIRRV